NYRELNTSLKDMYLSELSHRMNKVMQVLTIIATIFIPLTFIAGIYGMNFDYMPELSFKYGYFIVWFIMLFIAGWMLVLFRKNKWL
ncbi:MAG TPA: CorA family divalent cation transporter, partial [Bacteroidales bacterium]|nr:CorA family divalent cation transporter [Bacteroidales bacterium]